jgi:hypothetical protein
LTLDRVHAFDDVSFVDPDVLAVHSIDGPAEDYLRHPNHLLRERVLGAVWLDALPIRDEARCHFPAEQNRVARVGQLIDESDELVVLRPHQGHPIELPLRTTHKTVDRHLHLKLEFSHNHTLPFPPL